MGEYALATTLSMRGISEGKRRAKIRLGRFDHRKNPTGAVISFSSVICGKAGMMVAVTTTGGKAVSDDIIPGEVRMRRCVDCG